MWLALSLVTMLIAVAIILLGIGIAAGVYPPERYRERWPLRGSSSATIWFGIGGVLFGLFIALNAGLLLINRPTIWALLLLVSSVFCLLRSSWLIARTRGHGHISK